VKDLVRNVKSRYRGIPSSAPERNVITSKGKKVWVSFFWQGDIDEDEAFHRVRDLA